jgi:alkylation response protein AidB-like acyl-CoA dehydrogenase
MTSAFALLPEQMALRERARSIGQRSLLPLLEHAAKGRVNRPLVTMLGKSGLLPKLFPMAKGDGSARVSALELCLIREGLAMVCPEAETAFALQGLGTYPIVLAGQAEVRSYWLPRVARGEAVAGFALSEAEAGSDPGGLTLRAERQGDGFVLTGEKTWISNAPEADVYTVFARTSDGQGAKGITAFAVPGQAPGLTGEPIAMLAPHAIGRLRFERVPVPPNHVLGQVGEGFKVAMQTLDLFRPSVGAFAVGMAQRALDLAVSWARERRAFGKELTQHQAVSHALAEMATRTQAARLLVHAAAAAYDAGEARNTKNAAMAKLFATETAQQVVDAAIQVLGARGLVADHPLAHLYLEVRAPRIYEGTSEIQREIIARELFRASDPPAEEQA